MFNLDLKQRKKRDEWWENHQCSNKYLGACGGALTYMFTPTSLGMVIKVQCGFPDCNEVFDLTQYSDW